MCIFSVFVHIIRKQLRNWMNWLLNLFVVCDLFVTYMLHILSLYAAGNCVGCCFVKLCFPSFCQNICIYRPQH